MDALKAELALKRKALKDDPVTARPTKYMRRGDVERLKEEQEQQVRAEARMVAETVGQEKAAKLAAQRTVKVNQYLSPINFVS